MNVKDSMTEVLSHIHGLEERAYFLALIQTFTVSKHLHKVIKELRAATIAQIDARDEKPLSLADFL